MFIPLTPDEVDKLEKALDLNKFGALESWKLLVAFQTYSSDPTSIERVAEWAKRKNNGENITLPLKDYVKLEQIEAIFA